MTPTWDALQARPAAPSKVAPAAPAPRREEPTTRSPSGPSRASLKAEMMAVFTEIDDEEAPSISIAHLG